MKMTFQIYVEQLKQLLASLDDYELKRTEFAVAILQEMAEDRRIALRAEDRRMAEIVQANNNGDQAATQKQIEYLRDLGVEYEEGMTRAEVSMLIDEAEARRQRQRA